MERSKHIPNNAWRGIGYTTIVRLPRNKVSHPSWRWPDQIELACSWPIRGHQGKGDILIIKFGHKKHLNSLRLNRQFSTILSKFVLLVDSQSQWSPKCMQRELVIIDLYKPCTMITFLVQVENIQADHFASHGHIIYPGLPYTAGTYLRCSTTVANYFVQLFCSTTVTNYFV